MRIEEIQVEKLVENIAKKLGIDIETIVKTYCYEEDLDNRDENVKLLLRFENEIAERGLDVDEVMAHYCEKIREIEKKEKVVETVISIPVYKLGEEKKINLVIRNGKISVESDIENVCKEPSEVLIGKTTIYLKCGNNWISFLHGLKEEQVIKIEKLVKSCF